MTGEAWHRVRFGCWELRGPTGAVLASAVWETVGWRLWRGKDTSGLAQRGTFESLDAAMLAAGKT